MFTLLRKSKPVVILAITTLFAGTAAIAQAQTGSELNVGETAAAGTLTAVNVKNEKTITPRKDVSTPMWRPENSDRSGKVVKAPVTAASSSDPKWEFAFAPYLYLTGISGTVGARGHTLPIDLSVGDVLSHFKAGFMGTFEARRGRLVILNDLIWVKLTEETSTPGPLYDTAKVSVNMTIWNPAVGVRVAESKAGSFDVLGGLRLTSVKNILSTTTGVLPGFSVEGRKTWAAPVIGAHGLLNLSPKVYLSTIFDVGGGFGTHVTGQFYGGMGYRIKPNFALVGGYRYLKNDYSDDSGFLYDTSMNGLLMGAKFSF